jgi:DNA-binding NtrC family response regulator
MIESALRRVLIIDDDVHVCETLRRIMDHAGIGHRISLSAKSALAAATEFQPDTVIIDFVLPDQDGIALTQLIKRDHPEIRVVMISGLADFEETLGNLARSAGVNAFVPKPFRAAEILEVLKDL